MGGCRIGLPAALVLREGDRAELERLTRASAVSAVSAVSAGLVQRARIVLLAADGAANTAIGSPPGVTTSLQP